MHFVREKRDKPPRPGLSCGKILSDKREKREKTCSAGYSFPVRGHGLLFLDGQPERRASTARLLAVGDECAEGGKLFERSIDAFPIDVAIEET